MIKILVGIFVALTANVGAVEVGDGFIEEGLAYSKNFDYAASNDNANRIGAIVTYTSATFNALSFTDGRTSSGTITVESTTSLRGVKVSVAGVYFQFGPSTDMDVSVYKAVAVGADVTASAHNLITAINAHAGLANKVSATHTNGVCDLVSDLADGVPYPLTTSNASVVSLGGAAMGLGVAATVSGTTDKIYKANHGLTTALPVLYAGGTSDPSPLVDQTTYYIIPVDADYVYIATTSADAQAGDYIGLSGVALGTTAHTFTLTPLAIDGVPGFKWKASNDGSHWIDMSVSSVTMSAYTAGGTSSFWDFSWFPYKWLRMAVDGPSAGGIYIKSDLSVKK